MGVWVVMVGAATAKVQVETEKCRNSCSAVPEDMWPYCCESHNTCCQEFADSCIHDCLPRVHTGDVSAVEERPGLCCALYNLCCFRETFRISSGRSQTSEPVSLPIVHRFQVRPPATHEAPITLPVQAPRSQKSSRPTSFQPIQPQSQQTTPSDFTDEPREEKKTIPRSPLQRPQLLKKPTSRPSLPERSPLLKKPFGDPDNSEQPVEQKNSPSVQRDDTGEGPKEANKDDIPQDKKKTAEEHDRRKSLLETKKPKSGGLRLSGLLLGRRKDSELPNPVNVQAEENRELPREAEVAPISSPERGLLGTRHSEASQTEPAADPVQEENGRRNLAISHARVTRKRLRVPGLTVRDESTRTDQIHTVKANEQPIGRPLGVEETLTQPQINEGRVFGRQPGHGETRVSQTSLAEKSEVDQPQINEGTLVPRPQLAQGRPDLPQHAEERLVVAHEVTEESVPELPRVAEDILFGQAQVFKETENRQFAGKVGQPQVAEGILFPQPPLTEDRISGQPQISEERFSNPAYLDREVSTRSRVTEESSFGIPLPVESPFSQPPVIERTAFLPQSAGDTPVGQPQTYLPLSTEEKPFSQPEIVERTGGRSLKPNDRLISHPQDTEEKIGHHTQANIEIPGHSQTPVEHNDQPQVPDHLQIIAEATRKSPIVLEVPAKTQVSVEAVSHPHLGLLQATDEPQALLEKTIDQPEVNEKISGQTDVSVGDTSRGHGRTRARSNSRSREQSQPSERSGSEATQRDQTQGTNGRSSTANRLQGTPVASDRSQPTEGRSNPGVPHQTTRRRSSRRRVTRETVEGDNL